MVTGATGFVGRHVVSKLLSSGHSVVAVARDRDRARTMPWIDDVEFIACNLHVDFWSWEQFVVPDVLVHLAWPGLPNYRDFFHINENFPADLKFLESAVHAGVRHLLVAGTCLEYGMQYGPLSEDMETRPFTPYGFAKDVLRKSLQLLQKQTMFTLQWARLFYMHGEGQNPNSLLAQLDRAINEGKQVFEMSAGDQLRDYMSVENVAGCFSWLLDHPEVNGVINCCSGKPISVLDLVNRHRVQRNSDIALIRGHFSYPDYEPMAFWGIPAKLNQSGLSDFTEVGHKQG